MINFFRKIRKKLADDNKPLKYARYAIGAKNGQSEPLKTEFFEPLKKIVSDYAIKGFAINIAMFTLFRRGWYTMSVLST